MLYTILQMSALILTLESAIFLARGGLGLSAVIIADLSATRYSYYNKQLIRSLARQKADTWMGTLLLLGAFAFQVMSLWRGLLFDDIGPADRCGIVVTIFAGVLLFAICWWGTLRYSLCVVSKTLDIIRNGRHSS